MGSRLHNAPIVVDNGSGTIRAGFAGQDIPKCYFPSFVGRPKHVRAMAGALEGDVFIGPQAQQYRGLFKINYPLEHGIVTDWDDMERIWQYVYTEELKTVSEDVRATRVARAHGLTRQHPVLLTEPPLNPRENRDMAAQILFETFNVPALYTSVQAVLSLYASGKTTGIVLDSGDGVTHAVPVFQGFSIPNSVRRIDVAGRDVTEHLQQLLRKSGHVFHTSAEKETVKQIKEHTGYVALDPAKEEKEWSGAGRSDGKSTDYTLPDGQKLKVRGRRAVARCSAHRAGRRGALPRARDPVQPGAGRARVPWRAPDGGRGHLAHRHGPAQGAVRQHCALGRLDADQGLRQPAAARGAASGGQGNAHQDPRAARAHLHDVDGRQHPGRAQHVQKGACPGVRGLGWRGLG